MIKCQIILLLYLSKRIEWNFCIRQMRIYEKEKESKLKSWQLERISKYYFETSNRFVSFLNIFCFQTKIPNLLSFLEFERKDKNV